MSYHRCVLIPLLALASTRAVAPQSPSSNRLERYPLSFKEDIEKIDELQKNIATQRKALISAGRKRETCKVEHDIWQALLKPPSSMAFPCVENDATELDGGPSYFLIPPYPSAFPQHWKLLNPDSFTPYGKRFSHVILTGLVPAAQVERAKEVIEFWRASAQSHRLFNCDESKCKMIISGIDEGGRWSEMLALCEVDMVGSAFGPPRRQTCDMLSLTDSKQTWISALLRQDLGTIDICCPSSTGVQRFSLEFAGRPFDAPFTRELEELIQKGLSSPPLSLATASSDGHVIGVATLRQSLLFPDYMERMEVDVLIQSTRRRLEVNPDVILNRRKTTGVVYDWHPPAPEQSSAYLDLIRNSLIRALQSACHPQGKGEILSFTCTNGGR